MGILASAHDFFILHDSNYGPFCCGFCMAKYKPHPNCHSQNVLVITVILYDTSNWAKLLEADSNGCQLHQTQLSVDATNCATFFTMYNVNSVVQDGDCTTFFTPKKKRIEIPYLASGKCRPVVHIRQFSFFPF